MFSVSSSTSGDALTVTPVNFYGGIIDTTLPAYASALYRIDVPSDAVRWRHAATHAAEVQTFLEQGTVPLWKIATGSLTGKTAR